MDAFRAEPDRLIASVSFIHFVIAHDDLPVEQEHAILRWNASGDGAHEWHRLRHDESSSDAPASRVWFPTSAERAYWVTRDGRLVAFDFAARELIDASAGFVFEFVG